MERASRPGADDNAGGVAGLLELAGGSSLAYDAATDQYRLRIRVLAGHRSEPVGTDSPCARTSHARSRKYSVIVHLIDGTYELFRHFYGHRRFNRRKDRPGAAVGGVLYTVLEMIEKGASHLGVATDHVIESFRNDLRPEYKTGEGLEPALAAQFHPLEPMGGFRRRRLAMRSG